MWPWSSFAAGRVYLWANVGVNVVSRSGRPVDIISLQRNVWTSWVGSVGASRQARCGVRRRVLPSGYKCPARGACRNSRGSWACEGHRVGSGLECPAFLDLWRTRVLTFLHANAGYHADSPPLSSRQHPEPCSKSFQILSGAYHLRAKCAPEPLQDVHASDTKRVDMAQFETLFRGQVRPDRLWEPPWAGLTPRVRPSDSLHAGTRAGDP